MKKLLLILAFIPSLTFAFDIHYLTTDQMLQKTGASTVHGLYQGKMLKGVVFDEVIYVDKDYWNMQWVLGHEIGHVLFYHMEQWERDFWEESFNKGSIFCPTYYCTTSFEDSFAEIFAQLLQDGICKTDACEIVRLQMKEHPLDWPAVKKTPSLIKSVTITPNKRIVPKRATPKLSHFPNPRRSR